jgi:hypothetical protein
VRVVPHSSDEGLNAQDMVKQTVHSPAEHHKLQTLLAQIKSVLLFIFIMIYCFSFLFVILIYLLLFFVIFFSFFPIN